MCSGPLVKKLGLSDNDAACTRDQFTLLTLVMQGKARPRPSSLPPLPPPLATSRRLRKPDKPALEPASSHWAPSPRHSATPKVSERDLDECRAAFAALDATRSGRLTTEDLEAWQQAPRLKVPPSLSC